MKLNRLPIQFCTTPDDVRLAYKVAGSGPPVVKVASWLSDLEFDDSSPIWGDVITQLAASYTCVRYDTRGHGLSDHKRPVEAFEDLVTDLETVVEAAGLKRFALAAFLWGVPVAVTYAARHPERVSYLILHGGYARGRHLRDADPHVRMADETLAKMVEFGLSQEVQTFRYIAPAVFLPDSTAEQRDWISDLSPVPAPSIAAVIRATNTVDVQAESRQVACPTLVTHGVEDPIVPFNEGKLLAGLIPEARFVPLISRNSILLPHEPAWFTWANDVSKFLEPSLRPTGIFSQLTRRERDIVGLIATGMDNLQMAASLGLSEKTVRNAVSRLYNKLQVEGRSQAIVLARDAGFGKTGLAGTPAFTSGPIQEVAARA